jgi:membrane-associated phospholipid phosphatase
MILGLHPARNRHTLELIAITQVIAAHLAMIVKHYLACRRPDQIEARVQPMIPTPGHSSLPSAHATEAYAVATVLCALLDNTSSSLPDTENRKRLVFKQAERIAVNRTVAGVHFPIDSWAGAALGIAIARLLLNRCGVRRIPLFGYHYTAVGDADFAWPEPSEPPADRGLAPLGAVAAPPSDILSWLWDRVIEEYPAIRKRRKTTAGGGDV